MLTWSPIKLKIVILTNSNTSEYNAKEVSNREMNLKRPRSWKIFQNYSFIPVRYTEDLKEKKLTPRWADVSAQWTLARDIPYCPRQDERDRRSICFYLHLPLPCLRWVFYLLSSLSPKLDFPIDAFKNSGPLRFEYTKRNNIHIFI